MTENTLFLAVIITRWWSEISHLICPSDPTDLTQSLTHNPSQHSSPFHPASGVNKSKRAMCIKIKLRCIWAVDDQNPWNVSFVNFKCNYYNFVVIPFFPQCTEQQRQRLNSLLITCIVISLIPPTTRTPIILSFAYPQWMNEMAKVLAIMIDTRFFLIHVPFHVWR